MPLFCDNKPANGQQKSWFLTPPNSSYLPHTYSCMHTFRRFCSVPQSFAFSAASSDCKQNPTTLLLAKNSKFIPYFCLAHLSIVNIISDSIVLTASSILNLCLLRFSAHSECVGVFTCQRLKICTSELLFAWIIGVPYKEAVAKTSINLRNFPKLLSGAYIKYTCVCVLYTRMFVYMCKLHRESRYEF